MYDELGVYGVVIVLLIVLLFYALGALFNLLGYLLAAIYTFLAVLGAGLLSGLDALFSARLFAGHPEIGWAIGGLLLGAGVGAWTIAPVYGLRRARPIVLVLPVLLILALCSYGLSNPQPVHLSLTKQVPGTPNRSLTFPLKFAVLEQSSNVSTARFTLGSKQVTEPLVALKARPGEPDIFLSGSTDLPLGPLTLKIAPRHGGELSDDVNDHYYGSYMLQLTSEDQILSSFAVALPGDLVRWDRESRSWMQLGNGRSGDLDIEFRRELGLAKLITASSSHVLHVTFKPDKPVRRTSESRYSVDAASFPQGEMELRLESQAEERLIPAVERRLEDEQLVKETYAKPLSLDIELERVASKRVGNPYADLIFHLNNERAGRIEPLETEQARQAIMRGELDTQTKFRDLNHGISRETPEFRALVRFCAERDSSGNAAGSAPSILGSYLVTIYSRSVDFDLSFEVSSDGTMTLVQRDELPGLRSGKNYISIPATQFNLPGDPPYLTISFQHRGSQEETLSGIPREAYVFPSGILSVGSALHPRPSRRQ